MQQKQKLVILGDIYGEGIRELLAERLPSRVQVNSFLALGGKLKDVMVNIKDILAGLSPRDTVVIIGGSQDVAEGVPCLWTFRQALRLLPATWRPTIVFVDIPMRYDVPIVESIDHGNALVRQLLREKECKGRVKHLRLRGVFRRHMYMYNGVHWNMRGKLCVVELIRRTICHQPPGIGAKSLTLEERIRDPISMRLSDPQQAEKESMAAPGLASARPLARSYTMPSKQVDSDKEHLEKSNNHQEHSVVARIQPEAVVRGRPMGIRYCGRARVARHILGRGQRIERVATNLKEGSQYDMHWPSPWNRTRKLMSEIGDTEPYLACVRTSQQLGQESENTKAFTKPWSAVYWM